MRETICVVIVMFTLAGCSRLESEYGGTKGRLASQSLNGLSGLRQTFERQGATVKDIGRLNKSSMESNSIVWIPKSASGIEKETSIWMNGWLSQGGRTLIYIVPDSGSETHYYREMIPVAPPEQRLEYRRLLARSLVQRMQWQSNRQPLASNGWMEIKPLPADQLLVRSEGLRGEWSDAIVDQDQMTVEFSLSAYKPNSPPGPTIGTFAPTGPTQPKLFAPQGEVVVQSGNYKSKSLLSTRSGDAIVKVTCSNWKDSQVLVIAGGSLLTNYALAHQSGMSLADRIVKQARPILADKEFITSFVTTEVSEIPVHDSANKMQPPSGMEFLTSWPLSLVTIHGLIAGLIACLVMLPIFGRPRKLVEKKLANFGGHLDAIAALLSRLQSESYAENRIREFHRVVNQDEPRVAASVTDLTDADPAVTALLGKTKPPPTRPSNQQDTQ